MNNIKIKATYTGKGNMGYEVGNEYEITLFVYKEEIALIALNNQRYTFATITQLLNHFSNISIIRNS